MDRPPSETLMDRAWWPRAVTAAGVALAALFVTSVLVDTVGGHGHGRLVASAAVQLTGLVVLLASRRRAPGLVLAAEVVLAIVGHVLASGGGSNTSSVLVVVAVYRYGVARPTSRTVVVAAVVWVGLAAGSTLAGGYIGVIPMDFILVTAATAIALYVRSHRELLASMRVRAEQAEREQHWMADRAVAEERVRIARELHDVIAHHVSLLVVQAGAVRETLPRDHPTRAVLDSMITGGRQAMAEMRDMLTALRLPGAPPTVSSSATEVAGWLTAERGSSGSAGFPMAPPLEAEMAPRHPQPGLSDIPQLVDGARRAGQSVDLRLDGHPETVAPTTGLAAYRIVQEALTNVVKHAPAAPTAVRVACGAEAVELWVRNGRPPTPHPDGRSGSGPGPSQAVAVGHGLLGMHERVALAGGRLSAGPTTDGFTVHAWLPVFAPPSGSRPQSDTAVPTR